MYLLKNKQWKKVIVNDKYIEIPSDWNILILENLTNKIGDGLHGSPIYVEKSSFYFINGNNLRNGSVVIDKNTKCISEQTYLSLKKNLGNSSLLLSINGTIGNLSFFNNENVALGKSVAYINLQENINKIYIYHFLNSLQFKKNILFESTGSTIQNLSLASLRNSKITLPPENEQKDISDILSKQENIILLQEKKNQEKIKTIKFYQQILLSGKTRIKLSEEKEKELLSKGVISLVEEKTEKEQFSFFNINDGKVEEFVSLVDLTKDIVFYQNDESNWKTEEVNELQKQLPKDWNVEQLYKKVNFIKGKSIPENQLNYNGEGVKYLKTTEFWLDSSSKRDTVHYTGKVEEKYLKKKDEYVFSMDGFNNKIGEGTLGLISNEDEGIVSTSFYKLEKNDIYHLVVNVLKSNYVQNFIMRLGEGTTVYHAGKYMKNLQGIFPKSTVEQKLLSMIFEKEEKLVDSLKEKIKLEEKVFKYLQQELLSGRIRIKVEE